MTGTGLGTLVYHKLSLLAATQPLPRALSIDGQVLPATNQAKESVCIIFGFFLLAFLGDKNLESVLFFGFAF